MPLTESINRLVGEMNILVDAINEIRFRLKILEDEVLGAERLKRRDILFRRFEI